MTDNQLTEEPIRLENGVKLVRRLTMVNVSEDDGGFRRTVISLRKILDRMSAEEVKERVDHALKALID